MLSSKISFGSAYAGRDGLINYCSGGSSFGVFGCSASITVNFSILKEIYSLRSFQKRSFQKKIMMKANYLSFFVKNYGLAMFWCNKLSLLKVMILTCFD